MSRIELAAGASAPALDALITEPGVRAALSPLVLEADAAYSVGRSSIAWPQCEG